MPLMITVAYVNATEGHHYGEEPPHEPFTEDIGRLFRFALKEWGRCVSKVYVDTVDGKARPCGWVFQKRRRYEDARQGWPKDKAEYLAETWVTLLDGPDEVTRTRKHHFIG